LGIVDWLSWEPGEEGQHLELLQDGLIEMVACSKLLGRLLAHCTATF
jgi:hypothetical protein